MWLNHRFLTHLVTTTLLLFFASLSQADERYRVIRIYDGDTVLLKKTSHSKDHSKLKLRLADIDAPERNQAYGKQSRLALKDLCTGDDVTVEVTLLNKDQYGRDLGNLSCNEIDAALYLVELGLAWHNAKYSDNSATQHAEAIAREHQLGLWGNKKPTPPWQWRHIRQSKSK
ncbi:MAG: thermonuclease family protein [Methylotenera sp.]|jgi:endonuclease YncB( thermonuclease family)|nr:thermonuclease family protein [Methylotenera sp.]